MVLPASAPAAGAVPQHVQPAHVPYSNVNHLHAYVHSQGRPPITSEGPSIPYMHAYGNAAVHASNGHCNNGNVYAHPVGCGKGTGLPASQTHGIQGGRAHVWHRTLGSGPLSSDQLGESGKDARLQDTLNPHEHDHDPSTTVPPPAYNTRNII